MSVSAFIDQVWQNAVNLSEKKKQITQIKQDISDSAIKARVVCDKLIELIAHDNHESDECEM